MLGLQVDMHFNLFQGEEDEIQIFVPASKSSACAEAASTDLPPKSIADADTVVLADDKDAAAAAEAPSADAAPVKNDEVDRIADGRRDADAGGGESSRRELQNQTAVRVPKYVECTSTVKEENASGLISMDNFSQNSDLTGGKDSFHNRFHDGAEGKLPVPPIVKIFYCRYIVGKLISLGLFQTISHEQ